PRLVGRVLVQIDAHRETIRGDVPLEAVHGGNGSFVAVEPPVDSACRVVDIGHEDTVGASAFKPVMMGTVHLEHLSIVVLPLPPLPVGLPFAVFLPFSFFMSQVRTVSRLTVMSSRSA